MASKIIDEWNDMVNNHITNGFDEKDVFYMADFIINHGQMDFDKSNSSKQIFNWESMQVEVFFIANGNIKISSENNPIVYLYNDDAHYKIEVSTE